MVECEDCREDVFSVWRHAVGATADGETWLCADCHPTVTDRTPPAPTSDWS